MLCETCVDIRFERLCGKIGGHPRKVLNHLFLFDFFSRSLCILRMWVGLMMLLSVNTYEIRFNSKKEFNFIVNILIFLLLVSFILLNFFIFYISFELVVVPTFFFNFRNGI
jgi:formate hydrogenlyase subunit 3/multisubunit Na+/H+ antiporter MnhD subunit